MQESRLDEFRSGALVFSAARNSEIIKNRTEVNVVVFQNHFLGSSDLLAANGTLVAKKPVARGQRGKRHQVAVKRKRKKGSWG